MYFQIQFFPAEVFFWWIAFGANSNTWFDDDLIDGDNGF